MNKDKVDIELRKAQLKYIEEKYEFINTQMVKYEPESTELYKIFSEALSKAMAAMYDGVYMEKWDGFLTEHPEVLTEDSYEWKLISEDEK